MIQGALGRARAALIVGITAVAASATCGSAVGADLIIEPIIDRVTVYRKSAMVTRTAVIDVPAGDHRCLRSAEFRG